MNAAQITLLLSLFPLLVLSALFSGAETALFGMSFAERERLRRRSRKAYDAVAVLLSNPRRLLVTVLLGNMTVNVLYMLLSSLILLRGESVLVGVVVNVLSLAGLVLFAEVFAKLVAGSARVPFCMFVAGPLLGVHRVMGPLRAAIDTVLIVPLSRLIRPEQRVPDLTADELGELVRLSAQRGLLAGDEQVALERVIELGELRVRDIMTPRSECVWAPADGSPMDLLRLAQEKGLNRLLLRKGSPDLGVVGIVDVRRLGAEIAGSSSSSSMMTEVPARLIRPAMYVPESARLDQLLGRFRRERADVAVAVDEYGGVEGVVGVRDIAVRLVASLGTADGGAGVGVERIAPGRWSVPGRLGAKELIRQFRIEERSVATTVGGLIVERLGRLPTPGDAVRLGNVELRVASVVDRVAEKVELRLVSEGEGGVAGVGGDAAGDARGGRA